MKIKDIIEGIDHGFRLFPPLEVAVENSNISFPWPLPNPHDNSTWLYIDEAVIAGHRLFQVYFDANRHDILTKIEITNKTFSRWRAASQQFTLAKINPTASNRQAAIACIDEMQSIAGKMDAKLDEILTDWDNNSEHLVKTRYKI